MVEATDHAHAHWDLIAAEDKHYARVAVLETLIERWVHDLERRGFTVPAARERRLPALSRVGASRIWNTDTMASRYGITIPFDGVSLRRAPDWFHRLADLGYTDVWSAEVDGADGFTPLALAAAVGAAPPPRGRRHAGLHARRRAAGHERRRDGRGRRGTLHHGARRLEPAGRRALERRDLREALRAHA